jgi:hypothetical protein
MVLAITPPTPVSMHFFILLAFSVGSAEAATKGFLMRTPQKLMAKFAMLFLLFS